MAILRLNHIWINVVPDGDGIAFPSAPGRARSTAADGGRQKYSSGRRRVVIEEGVDRDYVFEMIRIPLDGIEALEELIGRTVLVRDNFGQKHYGSYTSVESAEYRDGLYRAKFTLLGVTQAEGE